MFLSLPTIGICLYFQWLVEEIKWINISGLVLCTGALIYFGWFQLLKNLKEKFYCRIVPYFERRLGVSEDAFETGIELCRRCRMLDELATQAGVATLSSFGFRDDQDGQKLKWYDASDGLQTVEKLIRPIEVSSSLSLLSDLKKLEHVLQEAQKQKIQFCLIVRAGLDKSISPLEMDNRKGYFW
ncbi:MAG: hypothetical protein ABIP76_13470 [Verrucomicrobiota bacterium]